MNQQNGGLPASDSVPSPDSSSSTFEPTSSELFIRHHSNVGDKVGQNDSARVHPLLVDDSSEFIETFDDIPPLSFWRLLALCSYQIAHSAAWFSLLIVIVPSQVLNIMGDDEKGRGVSILFLVSGFFMLFVIPVVGIINDRTSTPFGRRRPAVVLGAILFCGLVFGLSSSISFPVYVVIFTLASLSSVIAALPFNALVADVVPPKQLGRASAFLSAFNTIGVVLGAVLGLIYMLVDNWVTYLIMALLMMVCVVITCAAGSLESKEPAQPAPWSWSGFLRSLFAPFIESHNYRVLVYMRIFVQLGIVTIEEFLQYWLKNCVDLPVTLTSEQAVSIAYLPAMASSICSAILVGLSTDMRKIRKRHIVWIALSVMTGSCIVLILAKSFWLALVGSGIYGFGYGGFLVASYALMLEELPDRSSSAARDIGFWMMAAVVAQIIAAPLGGFLLDVFQDIGARENIPCLGYTFIFAMTMLYFLLGLLCSFFIRPTPVTPPSERAMIPDGKRV